MNRFSIVSFLAALLIANPASAETSRSELRANTLALDLHLSLGLQKAKDANLAIGTVLQRSPLTENEFHNIAKSFVDEIGTIRAILFIDDEGLLFADSYKYPATNHNLSKREYYRRAVAAPDGKAVVSSPVNGKDSGTSFVPIARAVERHGAFVGVTVAVVSPRKLINLDVTDNCTDCMSVLVTTDGDVIAQEPAELENDVLMDLVTKLNSRPSTGFDRVKIGEKQVSIAWKRNSLAPVTSVYLKFDRD